MSRVFVSGHGENPGGEPTFVPDGVTLHFYADVDTASLSSLNMAVLATGGVSGSLEQFEAGAEVPNYTFTALHDAWIAAELTAVRDESELLFIGNVWWDAGRVSLANPIRFCNGNSETCMNGQHLCEGILSLLPEAGYDEIHMLACRVRTGDKNYKSTTRFPGEEQPGSLHTHLANTAEAINAYAKQDSEDGGHRAEEYFDSFQPEEQATMMGGTGIEGWSYNLHAREFLHEHGPKIFYAFYVGQTAEEQGYYVQDDELSAAIAEVRADYRHEMAIAESHGELSSMLESLAPKMREDLETMQTQYQLGKQRLQLNLDAIENVAETLTRRIETIQYRRELLRELWSWQVLETKLIERYVQFWNELETIPLDAQAESQQEMRDLFLQIRQNHSGVARASRDHKVRWGDLASEVDASDAYVQACAVEPAAALNMRGYLTWGEGEKLVPFKDAYVEFKKTLGIADTAFSEALRAYEVTEKADGGHTEGAINSSDMIDIREWTRSDRGINIARIDDYRLGEVTRQSLLVAVANSLGALGRVDAALAQLLAVSQVELMRVAAAQHAFQVMRAGLFPA